MGSSVLDLGGAGGLARVALGVLAVGGVACWLCCVYLGVVVVVDSVVSFLCGGGV